MLRAFSLKIFGGIMLKNIKSFLEKDPKMIDINPNRENLRKVLCWRLVTLFISAVIAYLYLDELYNTFEMVAIEAVILTTLHYIYEELWSKNE
jgi:uncharacterized membrane protein